MESLKMVPYVLLGLAIAGVVGGAAILTLGTFGSSVDRCWNSSYTYVTASDTCLNNTNIGGAIGAGTENLNLSDTYYGIKNSKEGMMTVAQQFSTIGIIAVMVIIIALLAGVFVYMNYFR